MKKLLSGFLLLTIFSSCNVNVTDEDNPIENFSVEDDPVEGIEVTPEQLEEWNMTEEEFIEIITPYAEEDFANPDFFTDIVVDENEFAASRASGSGGGLINYLGLNTLPDEYILHQDLDNRIALVGINTAVIHFLGECKGWMAWRRE